MANHSKITVAAFDFDGTLTYHDSLVPFFLFIFGRRITYTNLFLEIPNFLLFVIGYRTRQQIKERLITRFLKGKSHQEIKKLSEQFAEKKIPHLLRPEALPRIEWHKQQGHICVLISANLDIYLEPWGRLVGFDHIIASHVEFTTDGYVTGRLTGKNCRGAEKVKRLIEILGPKDYFLYAYGDSAGDKELLDFADCSYYRKLK